jgi:signal transduction histidine kinase
VVQRSERIRRIATWLALAASLAAGLLFVAVRVATPSDGARVAFYGEGWSAAGIRIAPIDQPAVGLQSGDLVQAVAGVPLETWARAAFDRGGRPAGPAAPVEYEVVRGESLLAVEVAWAPPSIGATLLEGWSVLLFSVAVAGVAAFVFARRPDEPAATALIVAACGAAGSSLPWFLGITVSDVVQGGPLLLHALVTGPLYMLLWPAGLHLALVFPAPLPVVTRRPAIVPLVYLLALGAYCLITTITGLAASTTLDWIGTWPVTQVAIVVPSLVVSIGLFVRSYRRTADGVARDRTRWATLGGLASAVLGLALFMLPELVLRHPLIPDAAIGLIALPLPLGIAAGILRNRLFDIDAALNRTLVYGGLTLGVLATYVAAASAISSVIGSGTTFGTSLLSTGIAALVALPLRDVLQRAANRLLYGHRDEPWVAMRRLGLRLEWAADPARAFPAIAETVADALRLPYVAVEVTDELGRTAIVAEHGAEVRSVESVALVHGGEPVGRLVLGVRSGERGFRPDELAFLQDLGRQAGAAVHALRLRDDLAASRERLVVTREEERRRLRRDLHDGLGPALAAIGMRAEASAAVLDDDSAAARRQLEALTGEVQAALADVRRLVDGLRPPALDDLGLVGAIRQQAARLDDPSAASEGRAAPDAPARTRIEVESRPSPLPDLPAAVEVAAFRIAVEAMTNAVRHAAATTCRVRVESGRQLLVEVVDDGRGVPPVRRPGTGLESMRERAAELGGDLRVEPRPEGGTRVVARIPIGHASPP